MNERIKGLVKQAGGHFSTHNLMSNPVQHRESIELWDKNIEKFAELMVRETLDQVAEFNRLTKAYQTQGIDPEIDVTKEVLKNFGFTRFPRS